MSRVADLSGPRFQVQGDQGAYLIEGLDGQEQALSDGVRPDEPVYGVASEETWGMLSVGGSVSRFRTLDGDYPAFYVGLAASILRDEPLPVSAEAALRTLQVIENIYDTVPVRRIDRR